MGLVSFIRGIDLARFISYPFNDLRLIPAQNLLTILHSAFQYDLGYAYTSNVLTSATALNKSVTDIDLDDSNFLGGAYMVLQDTNGPTQPGEGSILPVAPAQASVFAMTYGCHVLKAKSIVSQIYAILGLTLSYLTTLWTLYISIGHSSRRNFSKKNGATFQYCTGCDYTMCGLPLVNLQSAKPTGSGTSLAPSRSSQVPQGLSPPSPSQGAAGTASNPSGSSPPVQPAQSGLSSGQALTSPPPVAHSTSARQNTPGPTPDTTSSGPTVNPMLNTPSGTATNVWHGQSAPAAGQTAGAGAP